MNLQDNNSLDISPKKYAEFNMVLNGKQIHKIFQNSKYCVLINKKKKIRNRKRSSLSYFCPRYGKAIFLLLTSQPLPKKLIDISQFTCFTFYAASSGFSNTSVQEHLPQQCLSLIAAMNTPAPHCSEVHSRLSRWILPFSSTWGKRKINKTHLNISKAIKW